MQDPAGYLYRTALNGWFPAWPPTGPDLQFGPAGPGPVTELASVPGPGPTGYCSFSTRFLPLCRAQLEPVEERSGVGERVRTLAARDLVRHPDLHVVARTRDRGERSLHRERACESLVDDELAHVDAIDRDGPVHLGPAVQDVRDDAGLEKYPVHGRWPRERLLDLVAPGCRPEVPHLVVVDEPLAPHDRRGARREHEDRGRSDRARARRRRRWHQGHEPDREHGQDTKACAPSGDPDHSSPFLAMSVR